jgi:hypothetical protein
MDSRLSCPCRFVIDATGVRFSGAMMDETHHESPETCLDS